MQALRGLVWLLVLQSLGEVLARGLSLPFPGPVVGMVLLLLALRWRLVREPVAVCADFLLSHLSLLFVPVGVGVMTHLSLVSQYGVRMLVVIVVSTLAGLAVTVLTLHLLRNRPGSGKPPPEEVPHA
ncbi:CidA/LrgA family protein [Polaromonas sp.]|uniref:CidA/LrgA family protein n=1 Tax=Polaromonas sp. TaxID=1869339 RepID=UPI00179D83FD|nr:CidA/LrgA family protein [Polaromonas sp.]NMM07539.1 CidA/LrgA family protein [Polaromonas sp.]